MLDVFVDLTWPPVREQKRAAGCDDVKFFIGDVRASLAFSFRSLASGRAGFCVQRENRKKARGASGIGAAWTMSKWEGDGSGARCGGYTSSWCDVAMQMGDVVGREVTAWCFV